MLGIRYPNEVNLAGDSAATLEALIPQLATKPDQSWRERIEGWVAVSYVTWEQRAMVGDIRFEASQGLPDVPYAEWAKLLGLDGIRITDRDDAAPAWTRALNADRPFVLEAMVDTNVPPLPPHITPDQAAAVTRALLKGDLYRMTLEERLPGVIANPPASTRRSSGPATTTRTGRRCTCVRPVSCIRGAHRPSGFSNWSMRHVRMPRSPAATIRSGRAGATERISGLLS
jgi:hypothetical protein